MYLNWPPNRHHTPKEYRSPSALRNQASLSQVNLQPRINRNLRNLYLRWKAQRLGCLSRSTCPRKGRRWSRPGGLCQRNCREPSRIRCVKQGPTFTLRPFRQRSKKKRPQKKNRVESMLSPQKHRQTPPRILASDRNQKQGHPHTPMPPGVRIQPPMAGKKPP